MTKPCKPWCGTGEVAAREAFYLRKGRFYCRDRCVRAAARMERALAAPGKDKP